jgi:hypothetical protein
LRNSQDACCSSNPAKSICSGKVYLNLKADICLCKVIALCAARPLLRVRRVGLSAFLHTSKYCIYIFLYTMQHMADTGKHPKETS